LVYIEYWIIYISNVHFLLSHLVDATTVNNTSILLMSI